MLYEFKREDGEWIEMEFPIGQCPREIACSDGVKARRGWRTPPQVVWKDGQEPEATLARKSQRRRRDNIEAGRRGHDYWKERMARPKW